MSPALRKRLEKILSLLESYQDGEALSATRMFVKLMAAEGERDRLREALQKLAGIAAIAWMDSNAQRFRIWTDARAALTPAPEAPKDGE